VHSVRACVCLASPPHPTPKRVNLQRSCPLPAPTQAAPQPQPYSPWWWYGAAWLGAARPAAAPPTWHPSGVWCVRPSQKQCQCDAGGCTTLCMCGRACAWRCLLSQPSPPPHFPGHTPSCNVRVCCCCLGQPALGTALAVGGRTTASFPQTCPLCPSVTRTLWWGWR
jgi:hypothetical protein